MIMQHSQKRLLVVEDNPHVAAGLVIRFKSLGFDVHLATDAVQGLAMTTRLAPDVLLLDISIPGGNGLELTRQLQAKPETRNIPVIFVTGSSDPSLRSRAASLNVAGLCEKPYDPGELVSLVEFVVSETSSFGRKHAASRRATGLESIQKNMHRILIVEDDCNIARALALRMTQAGFSTAVAHDALNGIRLAVEQRPDLILLDITMPAGDGFKVAERIQAAFPVPPPIIFLTASKAPGHKLRAQALGASGFFEKPYPPEQLVAAVTEIVQKRQSGMTPALEVA